MKKNVKLLVLALGFGLAMTGVSTQAQAFSFGKLIHKAQKAIGGEPTFCCEGQSCFKDKCKSGAACGNNGTCIQAKNQAAAEAAAPQDEAQDDTAAQ